MLMELIWLRKRSLFIFLPPSPPVYITTTVWPSPSHSPSWARERGERGREVRHKDTETHTRKKVLPRRSAFKTAAELLS